MLGRVVALQLLQIDQLPTNCRQVSRPRPFDGIEVGRAIMQAQEKRPGLFIKTRPDVRDQPFAGFEQVVKTDMDLRHAFKLLRIRLVEVDKVRVQKFMRGTR